MRALPGWIAKGGAEGLMCASGEGLGVALKAEDGAARALRPALSAFLGRLGHELPSGFGVVNVENSRGEPVGEIVAA
jgi:L-asparaginase II